MAELVHAGVEQIAAHPGHGSAGRRPTRESLDRLSRHDEPGMFGLMFPDRGDFVAFVGLLGSRPLLQTTVRSFRSHTSFPSIGGVAPGFVPGIGWSDHWAFAAHGFQALMITDTAPFRYPHYHRPSDTPDKVDTASLARVVKGIERVIRELAR